jgi:hypothetical protein
MVVCGCYVLNHIPAGASWASIDATAAQTLGLLAMVLRRMPGLALTMCYNVLCFVTLHLCRRVLGIDATAAQTLGSLAMVLRRMGVELVISRVANRSIRRLLVAHGIITSSSAGGARKFFAMGSVCVIHCLGQGKPGVLFMPDARAVNRSLVWEDAGNIFMPSVCVRWHMASSPAAAQVGLLQAWCSVKLLPVCTTRVTSRCHNS